MKAVLNKRERGGDFLLLMMMINDEISKTHEDNVKINYTFVNYNIFCALIFHQSCPFSSPLLFCP